jgi:beta-N-acetylhexosaminidase
LERARKALASRKAPKPFDRVAARAELDALIDRAGTAGAGTAGV